VMAAAAAGWMWRRQAAAPPPAPKPKLVQFTGPEAALTGQVRAQDVVQIAAPIEGTVESFDVETGQPVYEGQLLGRIKNTGIEAEEQTARAELERAQARLEKAESLMLPLRLEASRTQGEAGRAESEFDAAERAYKRQQMLDREGATPHRLFEKAVAEYESATISREGAAELARAAGDRYNAAVKSLDTARQFISEKTRAMDEAKERAATAEIHAPSDGLLIARSRNVGEEVTPDVHDLFIMAVNLAALEAVAQPAPPLLARIRKGQPALLTFADFPEPVPGTVKQADAGGTVVEFNSPSPLLLPGMTVEIRVKLD
jgi:multidrug resistance efflux pump